MDATTVEVALDPEEALGRAVQMMVQQGYTVQSYAPRAATFNMRGTTNTALGCFLMLFFIVPGLLYLLLAQPKLIEVTIAAYPLDYGARLAVGGTSRPHVEGVLEWARTLPPLPGTP